MSELHDLSAAQQLRALRAREVSSRELTEHYLQRIDRDGDALGAFVTVVPDLALDAADCADRAIARGELAALTGLPLGIKDLQATAGIQTTAGTAALVGMIPAEDSWTVGLLRAAGAVFVGKTNASELGSTCYTEDYVAANPAVTPYDRTRYSSGSSGGGGPGGGARVGGGAPGRGGAGSNPTPPPGPHPGGEERPRRWPQVCFPSRMAATEQDPSARPRRPRTLSA
ncbi:amidase family protein [Microbacterium sp.]|uniref:amidase family protein n=1 Tax=Microbacterium sp. TaxID=51671 RepID=UPI003F94882E